jgi:uncharacterized protein YegL
MNSEITLFDNPSPRCPVVLLLDTSGSMEGEPVNALNEGLKVFYDEIRNDEVAKYSVETSIITFGGRVDEVMEFRNCSEDFEAPVLSASGCTPLGEALDLALDRIKERRNYYSGEGLSAYKPWVFILSDGMPNDDWYEAAERAKKMYEDKDLLYIGIGVGDNIDMNLFGEVMASSLPPKKLDGLKFSELFKWISDSLKSSTNSQGDFIIADGWESICI